MSDGNDLPVSIQPFRMRRVIIIISLFFLLHGFDAASQSIYQGVVMSDKLTEMMGSDSLKSVKMGKVFISGNRRTKNAIILREIQCHEGDSMPLNQLLILLKESRDLIYNTNLFSIVDLHPVIHSASVVDVEIDVVERISFYPTPEFRLSDRNFTEWWKTYHADLGRITYGVKLRHNNVSGRADRLSIYIMNGFYRNISLNYTTPYFNKEMTKGFSAGISFTQQKDYPVATTYNNKFRTYKKEDHNKTVYTINTTYILRKGYYRRNYWAFQLTSMQLPDSVFAEKYNPQYLLSKSNDILIPELSYTHQYIKTDNINYPLKGKIFQFTIAKRGLGWKGSANMTSLDFQYKYYFPIDKNYFGSIVTHHKLKLPFTQAYINQAAFGYADYYLRGLEQYVIDGVATSLNKFTLSRKLISQKIKVPFRNRYLPYFPFDIFLKTYGDVGYAYLPKEQDSRLNNTFLYSGGLGLDLLSIYDTRFSFEYSLNQLGEKGLFLHLRSFF